MNAKELKRLLRKQTGCSTWRMIVPDKHYHALRIGVMHQLIHVYIENQKKYIDEEWDCDDIARDFWCFTKRVVSKPKKGNGIVGRVIFPDHAEIIYVQERYAKDGLGHVFYIDQRDWIIRRPNKKPKWIEM